MKDRLGNLTLEGPHSRLRSELAALMTETRERTLALARMVSEKERCLRVSPYYSPFDWHLGHIGMTESYWVLQRAGGSISSDPELDFVFANIPENPKEKRAALPPRTQILEYLDRIRADVLKFLSQADFDSPDRLLRDAYCFRFVLAHEWQHQETMIELLHLLDHVTPAPPLAPARKVGKSAATPGREIVIPAGEFIMGTDDIHCYDNEQPAHPVFVPAFAIEETPVTVARYAKFMADEGYSRQELWDDNGWDWVNSHHPIGPGYSSRGPFGSREPDPDEPVCGVNWYEASAFARWAGRRLPTEPEWEKAAAWDPALRHSRKYPWGDEGTTPQNGRWALGVGHWDFEPSGSEQEFDRFFQKADHDVAAWEPAPVGSFSGGRSASGLLDMAGGVWEWTSSLFTSYDGFEAYPYDGYSKESFDEQHYVLKGGSWATRGPLLRCSFRNFYFSHYRQGFLGFRLARSL